jgi:menaquinone-dependent protoporphyrinogen oxidase
MSILLAYATQYGCTAKCANMLSENLKGDDSSITVSVVDLGGKQKISLNDYDVVIIGGPITAGKINTRVKKFCADNLPELVKKKIGLFICGAAAEESQKELSDNFPQGLLDVAVVKGYFGYEFNLEKMNFAMRAIIKKISKIDKSVSNILEDNIKEFAASMKK